MISRRTALRWGTGSLAGIGGRAPALISRQYVDDLPGFVRDRRDVAAAQANRRAIMTAFGAGHRTLRIRAGTRFAIDRSIILPSGAALVGEGQGEGRATIVMPAAFFTHRSLGVSERYAPDAIGIMIAGGKRAAEASRDVRIMNLDLRCEQGDGRALRGVVARNAVNLELSDVSISGLSVGVAFCLASVQGGWLSRCRAHDCHSDMDWGRDAHPQITGLEIDNDQVAGLGTSDLVVEEFRAENLTVGPTFLAAHGYETDGINICSTKAVRNCFRDILVRNVGEGIDTFGCDSRFEGVVAQDCRIFGIKCVHGASRNLFDRPVIHNAGLAGITVSGSNQRGDAVGNRFVSPLIESIDPEGMWSRSDTG